MAKSKRPFLSGYKTYDTSKGFGSASQWRAAFSERMGREQAATVLQEKRHTPWTVLGLVQGASQQQIKQAFRKAIMEWHPDRNAHRVQEAYVMSRQIIAAYELLRMD